MYIRVWTSRGQHILVVNDGTTPLFSCRADFEVISPKYSCVTWYIQSELDSVLRGFIARNNRKYLSYNRLYMVYIYISYTRYILLVYVYYVYTMCRKQNRTVLGWLRILRTAWCIIAANKCIAHILLQTRSTLLCRPRVYTCILSYTKSVYMHE